jgi:hypothetical protein
MMNHRYKGRIIDARSLERRDGLGWTSNFSVLEKRDGDLLETMFYLREIFPDMESATNAAIIVGRRTIDAGFQPLVPL